MYLNEFRITKACIFIEKDSTIKILDLGQKVGFNSSNSFIRVFKNQMGMSPKSYSKLVKEKNKCSNEHLLITLFYPNRR